MPPRKKARHISPGNNSRKDAEPSRRSVQSNRGVGGHVAQLQKAGEMVMAPTRQRKGAIEMSDSEENPMAPLQVAPAKAKAVQPECQCARSPHPFLHTAHHSDRFWFKLPSATDSRDLTGPGRSQNKTREMEQDSPDRDELEYDTYDNDMQDNEDLFRNPDDSYQQHEQDKQDKLDGEHGEHDDKQEDEQDNKQDNKQDNNQDKYEQQDYEQDK
ncbi:uncharacterized protein HD556DRAFT_1446401 [Suillus plorans]|uniref:Uncharacterized protein n=1 Tax=Suillus plorans TaxID=116603 RepID=A0A9P7AI45_9AGAM|nr:uncharacterized protein HD556DRAFT_1446401 [Suillus plorans]KAG1790048.1 hypothetical protein HD556DRAFT_1446401 [Suillus plorans]